MMPNGLLNGKNIVVYGVANHRSIAYAIARAMAEQGANIALSFQGERVKETVEGLGDEIGAKYVAPCDIQREDELSSFFKGLRSEFQTLDGLVHSIAFAPSEELKGRFIDTSVEGSLIAHQVSSDSFRLLAQLSEPMLSEGASLMTLTYLGSQRVLPHYNVMGPAKASLEATVRALAYDLGGNKVRVNGISAPPIATLASRAIPGIKEMIRAVGERAPLGQMTAEEIAGIAVFLASDLSRAMTGEILTADGGYSIMGI